MAIEANFTKMAKELDAIMCDPDAYMDIFKITREEAQANIQLYTELKDAATLGDKAARDYLISTYSRLLMEKYKVNERNIDDYVNFNNMKDNEINIIFEIIVDTFDFKNIIKKYDFKEKITEDDILNILEIEEEEIRKNFDDLPSKVSLVSKLIYAREYGQDCIDTIQHHNINEIGIIDKDYVYVVDGGQKIYLEFLHFRNTNVIKNIQKKTTQRAPKNYDEQNPTLVASKLNSSRITVAGFKSTPDDDALYYNERIFNLDKINLEEMRDRYNTIDDLMYDLVVLNQKGRGSHFVTGSDMGVGKSTFLLAMMEKVPNIWGIGVLDTQNELQAKKKYPWKNIITLIENKQVDLQGSFAIMLKMARDVLYVGEITQPREVAELINSSLRLNSGVGATLHSLSPFEVVINLRNLMMRTEMYKEGDIAEADIARGLDLVVHLAKLDSGRIIVENIVEVTYVNQDHKVDIVKEGTIKDKVTNLLDLAQISLSKFLYSKYYAYNEIIRFDRKKDEWIPINLPSETYFTKIGKYVPEEEIEAFKERFKRAKSKVGQVE